jgi:hypothetical protein
VTKASGNVAGSRRRSVLLAGAVAVVVVGALVAGMLAGGSGTPARDASSWPSMTFASSFVTPAGSWAIVPMGDLREPLNTFWQIFFRAKGKSRWSLVTPPGVAGNGGLAAAVGPANVVTVAFGPTNLLKFSPFETTTDDGTKWTVGVIPFGIPTLPDVLVLPTEMSEQLAALDGNLNEIMSGTGAEAEWSDLYDESGLARSPAGRECDVGALTALAGLGSDQLVGSTCRARGVVGIFRAPVGAVSDWQLIGPTVDTPTSDFDVLRLSATGGRISALVYGRGVASGVDRGGQPDSGAPNSLYGMWTDQPGSGSGRAPAWSVSAPLALGAHAAIVSTGFGANGSLVVETKSSGGSLEAWTISAGAKSWQALPPLPVATQSVSIGVDGTTTALAVGLSLLTVWRLENGSWTKTQSDVVPIQFGSSS